MKRLLLLLALLLTLPAAGNAESFIVSAATSLTDVFSDIGTAFEKAKPGVDVILNFAAPGALFSQMEQGAPVDVFASANTAWMDKALAKGLVIPETNVEFARNSLVLAVPKGNPAGVAAMADLTGAKVTKIGLGTPETVPAGQYAKEGITKAGIWDALEPKFIFGENVRQVLDYIARGEVDAGFVFLTDAVKAGEGVVIVAEVPLDTPVSYPIAVLGKAAQPGLAREFIAFVRSAEGRRLLEARGFKTPE